MAQAHQIHGEPIISAEVIDENIDTSAFVSTCTDAHLEQANHPEVLVFVGFVLKTAQYFESFTFVDPFVHFDLC